MGAPLREIGMYRIVHVDVSNGRVIVDREVVSGDWYEDDRFVELEKQVKKLNAQVTGRVHQYALEQSPNKILRC